MKRAVFLCLLGLWLSVSEPSWVQASGGQRYEPLAASVRDALHAAISDAAAPLTYREDDPEMQLWLQAMSPRLKRRFPDEAERLDFLRTAHYEATRSGLDVQMVLSLIQVESGFRKYAVSTAGARGYMQVMPFWLNVIGTDAHNLFHLRTNLRYGCTILRHYLDIEKGNLFRALGRYNGSLGQATYPNLILSAWTRNWAFEPPAVAAQAFLPLPH
jgi:soluble lytic murein transglycosylase-like protein